MPLGPHEIVGAGLAVLGSREILNKLLGPSAEYIGEKARDLVEKCDINLDNIFKKATEKLGKKIENPGSVSPRILKYVWDEGRFCEDELVAEYYAGILAASRTESGKDDRSVGYLAMVKELSTYQLRLHYVFYTLIKRIFNGKELSLQIDTDRGQMGIFIPEDVYKTALEFGEHEEENIIEIHCLEGLARQRLIIEDTAYGDKENVQKIFKNAQQPGMIMRPTVPGTALFLQALGYADRAPAELIDPQFVIEEPVIKIIDGAVPVHREGFPFERPAEYPDVKRG